MMKKILGLFLLSTLLLSCSSGQREKRQELRKLYSEKEFVKALKLLEGTAMGKDETLSLLVKMERANIKWTENNYYQANLGFNDAIDLSRKLYTEKFSQLATSGASNDNYKDFYGEKFERSMLYFYASLCSINLSQRGQRESYVLRTGEDRNVVENLIPEYLLKADEVRLEKLSSRAQILAWDSFLSNIKNDNFGKNVYKNDLLAKVYGGFVHEAMSTNQDDQIALQLYKDAKEVLYKNFNIYRTFNAKAKDFASDYKKLAELNAIELKTYVEPTQWSTSLNNFLDEKIKKLSKKEKKANFKFVLQEGLIAEKVPVMVDVSLKGAMNSSDDSGVKKSIQTFGATVLAAFAAQKLGLVSSHQSFSNNYLGMQVAGLAVSEAGIAFEIPKVVEKPVTEQYSLVIKNENGNVLFTKPLVLVSPLSDIAYESVKEEAIRRYTKTGVRVAMKHLTAIVGAYTTYKMMKGEENDFLARAAAIASYVGASKLISASEKADTRYWSTLPHTIQVIEADLPVGKYIAEMSITKDGQSRVVRIPDFSIQDPKEIKIVSYRHL